VKGGDKYALNFRARASANSTIGLAFSKAHEPWDSLGLYESCQLSPDWQCFWTEFVVAQDDDNARIHLDLGHNTGSLELAGMTLLHLPAGTAVQPSANGRSGSHPAGAAAPAPGQVEFGSLRRTKPVSPSRGLDRGLPVDRYYIRNFLSRNAAAIAGCVLEVGDDAYTREFGREKVLRSDVLHTAGGNPQATVVADLACVPQMPSDCFDCIILTQTLQFIFDFRGAIDTVHRILKPGGVVLATLPGISRTLRSVLAQRLVLELYSRFRAASLRRAFSAGNVQIESFGNVLAASCFLHGLAAEELTREELDYRDPGYEVTIAFATDQGGNRVIRALGIR
jgi:SAM-dependent methyltransferase